MKPPLRALILVSVSTPDQAQDKKQSLRTQERDLRAIADQRGWQVMTVLRIPGFSRDYVSWEECERDMLAADPPLTAMRELRLLTDQRAYDVFMVRDADRFGRTQSLIMQIAETICIRQRLKIYSQIDNMLVEGETARFWSAMTGLRSAGEMDKKRVYHEAGMDDRAKRGFYESHTPWYHRTAHDPETGEAVRVEVREEYRYIWDTVFDLVVNERIGFTLLEKHLKDDYGIVNPLTGKQFPGYTIYKLMYGSPGFWGHRARKIRPDHGQQHKVRGEWTFDETIAPPGEIRIWRDVLPPIYTGAQAEQIKAELRRRKEMRGGRKPGDLSPFAGLLVCDYCHYHLVYQGNSKKRWLAYRCVTKDHEKWDINRRICTAQLKSISLETVRAYVTSVIQQCATADGMARYFKPPDAHDLEWQLAHVDDQLQAAQQEARRLVDRLALVPDELLNLHRDKMRTVTDTVSTLQARREKLAASVRQIEMADQQRALDDILKIGLEKLWTLPNSTIHQMLHRWLGNWRMVVADGEVIGFKQLS